MLVVVQDVVLGKLLHYVSGHNVFIHLHRTHVRKTGQLLDALYFYPFLNIGDTFVVFQSLGTQSDLGVFGVLCYVVYID